MAGKTAQSGTDLGFIIVLRVDQSQGHYLRYSIPAIAIGQAVMRREPVWQMASLWDGHMQKLGGHDDRACTLWACAAPHTHTSPAKLMLLIVNLVIL